MPHSRRKHFGFSICAETLCAFGSAAISIAVKIQLILFSFSLSVVCHQLGYRRFRGLAYTSNVYVTLVIVTSEQSESGRMEAVEETKKKKKLNMMMAIKLAGNDALRTSRNGV